MLDDSLKSQLKTYLARMSAPIELVATLDTSPLSTEMRGLLDDIVAQSEQITLYVDGTASRVPSFEIRRAGAPRGVCFAGLPMGHEFTSLVLALLQTGGYPPKVEADVVAQIKALEGEFHFVTYFSQSCHNCPDVVQALNLLAILNPNITHVAVDGAAFQDEVEAQKIMAVPSVLLNGAAFGQGRMEIGEILAKIDTGAVQRDAAKLSEKEPFDVLVVGAGPAGAAAAIYTARKGIRTGIIADRFGGQVLDTVGIENFISVPYTEGPNLAAAMEEQTRSYNVDIMKPHSVSGLTPPTQPGGLFEVKTEAGAVLHAKAVILSVGAQWRAMNVPGEAEYRTKGVTNCPHCDGPFFKGKRVAVIGGGNSGIEAAIDLAGIVDHVTVIEFDSKLRADAVLVEKLKSLPNSTVILSARSTEVLGDGNKVTGLAYEDRTTGEIKTLTLEGIFVQIGLLPRTDWLKGQINLTPRGEIEVNAKCETSLPGVFAAGDATDVPYKQIIIAAGEGAKASLSAFDYLIRQSANA